MDPDLHDLMRSLHASRSQIFAKLELPSALPMIFGGLKLSVTLAVVGAVVGEFVGADAGLGFLINLGRGILDTPLMFVAVIVLVLIAQALYVAVVLLENHSCAGSAKDEYRRVRIHWKDVTYAKPVRVLR